jgi:hypothetical protein
MRTSIFTSTNETRNKTRSRNGFRSITGFAGRHLVLGAALSAGFAILGVAGCKSSSDAANPADSSTAASTDPNGTDPAAANSAPVSGTTQVAGYQQQAQPTEQGTTAAPIERRSPSSSGSAEQAPAPTYSDQGNGQSYAPDDSAEAGYDATLTDLQAPQPPPPLPEYAQPPAPEPNYIWTPGYWSYAPQGGYYWVPGAWTQPPYTGALWTPGYWGGYGSGYRFHHGFWGPHVGFYGGINYGFGYVGFGYQGGYWNGPHFFYNQYANNINISINPGFREAVYQHNVVYNNTVINNRIVTNTVYNTTTINNTRINNVSYNGGRGGVEAKPRPAELAVLHEQRTPPMAAQLQIAKASQQNKQQFYAANKGRPVEVAVARPLPADRGIAAPPHTTAQLVRNAPQARPQEQARPAETGGAMMSRPAPEAQRPQATPERPAMEARPQAAPRARAAQPEARPAPAQGHPAAPAANRPQPEAHPAAHPQPEARPAPQARPAPEARPAPQARPAPEAHPAAQARPAPQAHPQPHPQARPEQKPEEKKEPRG